ncbi:SAM-dependent methyltransferase [Bacteroides sp. 519]|nr:SAM-dependent methyltransferase [Bacteroides sp. 519]
MNLSSTTTNFIRNHQHDDVRSLALQAGKYPDVDIKAAITQIAGRQAAANKIPSWYAVEELLYPQHLSLEQCSSEVTAHYKSTLCKGNTFTDLTGGFGVDCAFIAANFAKATYIEKQSELCIIAKHNFPLLGLNHISVLNEDAITYLRNMDPVDCIFIDPARRDKHGKKTVQLSDCEPDVTLLEDLLLKKANRVVIKLSPMLDISLALRELKYATQVHILSVHNDCKELLVILDKSDTDLVTLHCVNFATTSQQEFTFSKIEEQNAQCVYTNEVDRFLYEPHASILKAGGYKIIAAKYNLKKLHPNSHLYTKDQYIEDFPGRVFQVEAYSSLKDKELLAGIDKANISTRNFPLSVADLRKRCKLKDGGEVYLFATTLQDNSKVLIRCKKF